RQVCCWGCLPLVGRTQRRRRPPHGRQPTPGRVIGAMTLETLTLGMWQANCHVLGDRETGSAVVVDPGQDGAGPVSERVAALGLRAEAVLLTHGHLDHLWSAPELATALDVPVLLHDDDRWLWQNPAAGFGDV